MDIIHRFTKKGFRNNVFGAIVASMLVTIFAAMLGRGILRIEGSVMEPEPTELTVARLIEPYELYPEEMYVLPKRADGEWRYSITMTDGQVFFVRIGKEGPPWKLVSKPEKLREGSIAR